MAAKKPERMTLIMSTVERGCGAKLHKLYRENQVFISLRCEGSGTATSEIMDILGLGSSEKDILISTAPVSTARALLERLDDDLRGAVPGSGIAFTIPLTAVNNLLAAFINLTTKTDRDSGGDTDMENSVKSSLILVTVNQGFTDVVMDTARKAGARGGTIIRARWAGDESFAQSRGFTHLQAEKEMIFIVVPKEIRAAVMEAINRKHGLQNEAGAMVSAVGIEQLVHLG